MSATAGSLGIAERIAAASRRIARVKRLDRLATAVITSGGVFIILSVLFMFVFIFAEALPLFEGARGEKLGSSDRVLPAGDAPVAVGVDEYQRYFYTTTTRGTIVFRRLADGALWRELPIPGIAGAQVTAAVRSLEGDRVTLGTADGRVAVGVVRFRPVFRGQQLHDLEVDVRGGPTAAIDAARRPVLQVSSQETAEGETLVAALVAPDEIAFARVAAETEGANETPAVSSLSQVRTRGGEKIASLRLSPAGGLAAGTVNGQIYHWEMDPEPRLTDVVSASSGAVTALEWSLGGATLLVGDAKGAVTAWFRARARAESDLALVRAHVFEPQGAAVSAIGPSTRDRSFVTAGSDGSLVLRHLTSERTLLRLPAGGGPVRHAFLAPRADGLLVTRANGGLDRYSITNPHPEVSWRALLGKVWYEGYPQPDYVWQSTGATDAFESKMSLVPLIFGTIKGTLYALVFAVPFAVMGALYTSQFVHPMIRAKVKPTVEIMAALPSVVIGFVAGLWLAPRVETALVPVLLLVVLLPAFGTAGVLLWDRLPFAVRNRLKPGTEVLLIVPLLLLGGYVAFATGPWFEDAFFAGEAKQWLSNTLGLVYDQRNSVVVGIAMGFAVIPIIFTISEDAFSSVPQHLTAASLALGASRWQTATRIVLPTASPGIFSAVMVGFGRAVGETMIVLMATGNTPLLDWSPFNGMRTLSANIAVEVPEAPYGGTLYRVLFLSACVLFVMTFAVNTVAELVRQRLREKYRAI